MISLLDKEKNARTSDQTTQTRVVAQFYSYPGKGFSGNSNSKIGFYKLGHIIGFSSSKQLGDPAGSWTLTIKKPPHMTSAQYSDLWVEPEGNWVLIKTLVDGTPYDTMLGIIDAVTDGVERSEMGSRSETYQIHGRDFGKVFAETRCFFDPFIPTAVPQYQAVVDFLGDRIIDKTPSQLVDAVITTWLYNASSAFGGEIPWQLPPGMRGRAFGDILKLDFEKQSPETHGTITDPTLLSPDGDTPFWDLMQSVSNGVMNELFVDLKYTGKPSGLSPTVTLRERAFPTRESRAAWEALPTFTITRNDVRSRQMAKGGGGNRYNFWLVCPQGASGVATIGALQKNTTPGISIPGESVPIVHMRSIQRFGMRKFQQESVFIPAPSSERQVDWAQLGVKWTQKIFDWYAVAPLQFSGSITLSRIYPEIRIGMRLIEKRSDGDMTYYVEGVDHSWMYPGTGQTTLTVTRGQKKNQDLLSAVYTDLLPIETSAANFTPLELLELKRAEETEGTVL